MNESDEFVNKLLNILRKRNIRLKQLAAYLDIPESQLSKVITGESIPELSLITQLARLFNLPACYFLKTDEYSCLSNGTESSKAHIRKFH